MSLAIPAGSDPLAGVLGGRIAVQGFRARLYSPGSPGGGAGSPGGGAGSPGGGAGQALSFGTK